MTPAILSSNPPGIAAGRAAAAGRSAAAAAVQASSPEAGISCTGAPGVWFSEKADGTNAGNSPSDSLTGAGTGVDSGAQTDAGSTVAADAAGCEPTNGAGLGFGSGAGA